MRVLNILIVDDEPIVLAVATKMIERLGHRAETSTNGVEALDRLRLAAPSFDVLITDDGMPELVGRDLVQQLPATPFRGPVFVFSGGSALDMESKYLGLGVRGFIAKPIDWTAVREMLSVISGELGIGPLERFEAAEANPAPFA
ncbi:MAG: hypothetical protein QOE70_669 [Chthoniobacter sp.]|jgi:CheY-like chemotaxis protein|nr:hypothetical protein [Chthoniobacter sp.]